MTAPKNEEDYPEWCDVCLSSINLLGECACITVHDVIKLDIDKPIHEQLIKDESDRRPTENS